MINVLLVFDRSRSTIVERRDYNEDSRAVALRERAELIRKYISQSDVEVVLLGSRSEAELRATHGRYFSPRIGVSA